MDSDSSRCNKEDFVALLEGFEAEDVLTPISMTQLINIEDSYEEIIEIISNSSHHCYPVYNDGIDDILGILYIRDLLINKSEPFDLHSLLHYPIFISENKNLLEILKEFKQKETSFAIVVDEHGAIRGTVTSEDILDSFCESSASDASLQDLVKMKGNDYLINARFPLDEFNKKFDQELIGEDCDSFGGFVIEQFTYVPELGEVLTIDNMVIAVSQTEGAKLQELTVSFNTK